MSNSTSELVLSASAGLQAAFRYRIGKVRANDRIQEPAGEALGAQAMVRHPSTRQNSSEISPILAGLALDKPPKGLTCDLCGKITIDWGLGALAWVQHAARNDKPITELRKEFREPDFPGFLSFIQPLSKLDNLPKSWIATLKSSRGVYLLTCPKTKEQYVGSARGEEGLWGRWQNYVNSGHGDNEGLKSRDPSDYQVSILEVAGTSATPEDIQTMEGRWQTKLQSREMGLNRNLAKKV